MTTETQPIVSTSRSKGRTPVAGTGFHQSWYPLLFANEIDQGQIVGRDFLGGRVVVYRNSEGKPVVQSAFCRHLGADLSIGKIVDGNLQCAFHHWQYNGDGQCVKIATGDKPPAGARLLNYPAAEAWGLIWAFNGTEPLFELPHMPGYEASQLLYETTPDPTQWEVEPWVLLSNSADIQHLRSFHGLTVYEPSEVNIGNFTIEYDIEFEDPTFGKFKQHVKNFGANTICLGGSINGQPVSLFASVCPTKGRKLTSFIVSSTPLPPGEVSPEQREQMMGLIRMNAQFFYKLAEEDKAIMDTIDFQEGYLVETDRLLAKYLKFVRNLPVYQPSSEY